jgi:hypothetical protein
VSELQNRRRTRRPAARHPRPGVQGQTVAGEQRKAPVANSFSPKQISVSNENVSGTNS